MSESFPAASKNGSATTSFTNATSRELYTPGNGSVTSDNFTHNRVTTPSDNFTDFGIFTNDNFTTDGATVAYDEFALASARSGNATLTSGGLVSLANHTTTPDILRSIATTMSQHDANLSSQSATTVSHNEDKVALVTDIQFHFLIVGSLFFVVLILALINLYIHFRSGGRARSLLDMKMSGGGRAAGGRRGGYTVKMAAKPSTFI